MGIISSLLFGAEKREFSLQRWTNWLDYGQPAISGKRVDTDTALGVSAIYCCVRYIAETIGTLPLALYEPLPGGGAQIAYDDPLHELLQNPNPEQTGVDHWEMQSASGALRGNAIAQIIRSNRDGRPKELWPIPLDNVKIERRADMLIYHVRKANGESVPLFDDDVFHFRLFSKDGIMGMSPLEIAKDNFGLAMAQEEYSNRMFKNGARPSGILSIGDVDESERKAAKEEWNKATAGLGNTGKTAVLPEGVKWQPMSMNHDELEFIASRKFQLAEIARIFRVPLPMLQELDRATFSNIEHLSLDFVIFTLRPWLTRWEKTMEKHLLQPSQRKRGMFIKFNEKALLRGAMKDQADFFSRMLQNGVYSVNEVRNYYDLNPVEGGDVHRVQMQNVDITKVDELAAEGKGNDQQADPQADPQAKEADQSQGTKKGDKKKPDKKQPKEEQKDGISGAESVQIRARDAFKTLISDNLTRIYRKENTAIMRNVAKMTAREFDAWLEEFAKDQGDQFLREVSLTVKSAALALAGDGHDEAIDGWMKRAAKRYATGMKTECRDLLQQHSDWHKFKAAATAHYQSRECVSNAQWSAEAVLSQIDAWKEENEDEEDVA